ncbi:MAG: hypothetical protein ABIP93_15060 [Gemmatimonadaceae bacterium]
MTARGEKEIALAGPPRNVTGLFPFDVSRSTIVPMSLRAGNEAAVYRAVVRSAGRSLGELRLRLPLDTPPGKYAGESMIGGEMRRVMVDVLAEMRINVRPKISNVSASVAGSAELTLTVTNEGNVPLDVPKADTFDLDDATGKDRALGKSLRAPLTQGERRVDRFFEELREQHGGEARVTIRVGAGRLEPGQTRELRCLLQLPDTAKEGRSYSGAWHLGNAAHLVAADVVAKGRPDNTNPAVRSKR